MREGRGRDRGQSTIEFMLMLPFVLFFVMAIVEFGFAYYSYVTVNHATAEAARYASLGRDTSDIRLRARETSNNLIACSDVTVTYPDGDSPQRGQPVTVSVNHTYETVTPAPALFSFFSAGAFPTSWDMNAYADARLESEPPPPGEGGC